MRSLLRRRGVTNCQVECRDFLRVDYRDPAEPTRNAQYLLVDPSCSGSGWLFFHSFLFFFLISTGYFRFIFSLSVLIIVRKVKITGNKKERVKKNRLLKFALAHVKFCVC